MTQLDWPPPYTLRQSRRARSVSFQICIRRGLQIVVPRRFNNQEIPTLLQKHRRWIERTWQRIQPRISTEETNHLPQEIHLLGGEEIWSIQYHAVDSRLKIKIDNEGKQLIVLGEITDSSKVKTLLKKWLCKQARYYLLVKLNELSQKTGLYYSKVSMRNATTRWGSCTTKKRISLNYKLYFLPRILIDHVILHELCHTVHLNHSKAFWNLLATFDANYYLLNKELKRADQYIPLWFE